MQKAPPFTGSKCLISRLSHAFSGQSDALQRREHHFSLFTRTSRSFSRPETRPFTECVLSRSCPNCTRTRPRETTYEQRGQLGRIAPRLSTSEGFATLRRVSPDTAVIFQRDRRARREGREGLRAQRGCRREQFRDLMTFRLTLDARNERVPDQDPPLPSRTRVVPLRRGGTVIPCRRNCNADRLARTHGPRVTIADRKPDSPSHHRPTASTTSDDPLADVTLIPDI